MESKHSSNPLGRSRGSESASQLASPLSRILSGSIGPIVYVLAFTPLEVVKTRQQAAAAAVATGSCLGRPSSGSYPSSSISSSSPSTHPVEAFPRGRSVLPKNAFPNFSVTPQHRFESTTACPNIMSYPRDKPRGMISTLRSISRTEGRAGLYAGLKPTLLATVPNTAIYFTAYDEIVLRLRENQALNNGPNDASQLSMYIPLLAGATARLVSSVATAPLEVVRTRQASTVGNSNSILEEFRLILRMNGPYALYKGLGPMILRDVPFSALYFLSLENFKSELSRSENLGTWGKRYYQDGGRKVPESVETMQAFISGSAAGAFATMVTTPFDVIKTRRQMVSPGENTALASHKRQVPGTLQLMRQIVQDEGFFAGLWKGNQTRLAKVVPGYGIMISCYELSKRLFDDML